MTDQVPGGAGAPEGWYPDPHGSDNLRYFDGTTWTDHFHRPGELPDVGNWLSASLGILKTHGLQAFGLAAGLGAVGSLGVWAAMRIAAGDISITPDGDVLNASASSLAIGAVLLIVTVLWGAVSELVLNRYMQRAHLRAESSIGEAFTRALGRLPRLIGFVVAYFLAILVAFFVLTAVAVAAGSVALGVFFGIFFLIVLVWASVKVAFFVAALAAAPAGTSALKASADVSKGRWWGTFGRLLLLWVLIFIISLILEAITGGVGSRFDEQAIVDRLQLDSDGNLTETLRFADLLPDSQLLVFLIISTIAGAITTVLATSANMRLYLDAGGPSET